MFSGSEGFWKPRNNMEYISFYFAYEVVCKTASIKEFFLINKQQLHYNASNHAKNMNQGLKNVVYLIFSYKLSLTLYMLAIQAFLFLPFLSQSGLVKDYPLFTMFSPQKCSHSSCMYIRSGDIDQNELYLTR